MRVLLLLTALVASSWSFPADMPEPGELALVLNEDDFEDYLDAWLAIEEQKLANASSPTPRNGKYDLPISTERSS